MYYKLDENGHPQPCSVKEWTTSFEDHETRIVAYNQIGDVTVSTVFLGLDHNFSGVGPPTLFETMIFGGELDQYQERYATRDDAVAGHVKALEMVTAIEEPSDNVLMVTVNGMFQVFERDVIVRPNNRIEFKEPPEAKDVINVITLKGERYVFIGDGSTIIFDPSVKTIKKKRGLRKKRSEPVFQRRLGRKLHL